MRERDVYKVLLALPNLAFINFNFFLLKTTLFLLNVQRRVLAKKKVINSRYDVIITEILVTSQESWGSDDIQNKENRKCDQTDQINSHGQ